MLVSHCKPLGPKISVISTFKFGYPHLTLKEGPKGKLNHIRRFLAHDFLYVGSILQTSRTNKKRVISTFAIVFMLQLIFDVFDSPEHNFDSWATKIIGQPDLRHSKPFAKFKRNPKRNVACRLNTRKSLWTQTMTVCDP